MADYSLYGNSCNIMQKDMVAVIQKEYPYFGKMQMSLASNPQRNALQLIPAAEDMLVEAFGPGPGLSISPKLTRKGRYHGNKLKPNRLYVRVTDRMRQELQELFELMGFATMQDMIEAALNEFLNNHDPKAFTTEARGGTRWSW